MLDCLMDGRPRPPDVVLPSDGVVARQSTDTIAVDDPHLAAAVHFIHDHLGEPFGVEQVVEASSISRRKLETRFRDTLGCTPYEYLSRRRVEQAKKLLATPDRIKFYNVAKACGFPSVDRMRLVFRRVMGMTPLEYRLAERSKGHY